MTFMREQAQARLEAKRAELKHEIAGLVSEEASSDGSGAGVEDVGETAQAFQEIQLDESLLQNQRRLLADVEEALVRLREGSYGRCLSCGQPIPEQRLEALPWAARDIACEVQQVAS